MQVVTGRFPALLEVAAAPRKLSQAARGLHRQLRQGQRRGHGLLQAVIRLLGRVRSLQPGDDTPHSPTHRLDPELHIKLLGHLAEFTRENRPESPLDILLAWLAAAFARENRPEPTLDILLPWLVAGFHPESGPDPPLDIHQQPLKAGFQSLDEAQPTVD